MDSGYPFLYWAYNIIWIGIAAYVVFLVVRLARVRERIARLERRASPGEPR